MVQSTMVKWEDGQSVVNTYIDLKNIALVPKVNTWTDKKTGKLAELTRLAIIAGNNGFGSHILGYDDKGNKVTVRLTVNLIPPSAPSTAQDNTAFEL